MIVGQNPAQLHFLGSGSGSSITLGSASAVLEVDAGTDQGFAPILLIDCGPTVPASFEAAYGKAPEAIYLTHAHFDHIGGLETLFYQLAFGALRPKLYVPHHLVSVMHSRLAEFPGLAEGGKNFWDVFQLIPVGAEFFHCGLRFHSFSVRHHAPQSAFGLALPGAFVYSGDTRPIPEIFAHFGSGVEVLCHDCSAKANPSHTGLEDLLREYPETLRARMVVYHQFDANEAARIRAAGFRVVSAGERVPLSCSLPTRR